MTEREDRSERGDSGRLAVQLVDALLRAGLVAPTDVEHALQVVLRELAARPKP